MNLTPENVLPLIALIVTLGSTSIAIMDPSFRKDYFTVVVAGGLGAVFGAYTRKDKGSA